MTKCMISYILKEIGGALAIFGVFLLLGGIIAGAFFGLAKLCVWLFTEDGAVALLLIAGGMLLAFGTVQGLSELYHKAKWECGEEE